jgi:hypothetical protein
VDTFYPLFRRETGWKNILNSTPSSPCGYYLLRETKYRSSKAKTIHPVQQSCPPLERGIFNTKYR